MIFVKTKKTPRVFGALCVIHQAEMIT